MAVLDLQALTDETINDLGLDSNSLWLIKIDKKVHGPFETGALKLHSGKFPEQFDDALASPMMSPNWQPFFSLPQFQRRTPEVLSHTDWDKAHYYVLIEGVKNGPHSMKDIESMWSEKEITLTDLISWDDGHQWTKLYLHPQFDRRHREAVGLPALPVETSFLRSEAEVSERWEMDENERPNVSTGLASLAYFNAHNSSRPQLKIEEIPFHAPKSDEEIFQNEKRKKIGISAAAVVLVGVFSSWLLLSEDNQNNDLAFENDVKSSPNKVRNSEADPSSWRTTNRTPASVPQPAAQVPRPRQEVIERNTNYAPEVYRESHSNYQEPITPEPYGEVEAPAMPEEHSLVQHGMPGEPLDNAFQPTEDAIPEPIPVVEEVSDF